MRIKKFWILVVILALAGGIWAILFKTNLLPEQKATVSKFFNKVVPFPRRGLIRGIVSSEGTFTALIDTHTVREGDNFQPLYIYYRHK